MEPPYLLAMRHPLTLCSPPNPAAMRASPQGAGAMNAAAPRAMKASPVMGRP